MIDVDAIRERYEALSPHERGRRIFAASEARTAGYGGIAAVSRATGIAVSTIGRVLKDLAASDKGARRVRRPGGGGKQRVAQDATLMADLTTLVESDARGDPMSPLRWTCKSVSQLTRALVAKSHRVGRTLARDLLRRQRFSLPTGRRAKGTATPIAMRSSPISTRACALPWRPVSP